MRRVEYRCAKQSPTTHAHDYARAYVADLGSVVDMDAIRSAGLRIGVDPLGGASLAFWHAIAERYAVDIEVVNDQVDAAFSFMPLDWDGRIRMDCSSPYAMAKLIGLKDRFDLAFGNDPDADRHGIVTPRRADEPEPLPVGGDLVPVCAPARMARRRGRRQDRREQQHDRPRCGASRARARRGARRVQVVRRGTARDGWLGFGGEESAGASFLRRDGTVWSTDKDGIIMNLLAVELTARTGRDPAELYGDLTRELGTPVYERIDAPATPEEKAALLALGPDAVHATELAGDPIEALLTTAPGNGAPIGGLKVITRDGWFAARPSGTEAVYKLYAESFRGLEHLRHIQQEARAIVATALAGAMR